ncbi:MAG: hypothetical protein RI933_44 [Actinomycetota bacterium]
MIYLDNAATTPVRREALEAAWPWLSSDFGNPSSKHELGLRAHDALEKSRERVAKFFNARSSEITFTSGGTEGANLAIIGLALANPRGKHLISAKTEHEAVLAAIDFLERQHGFEVSWLPVDGEGRINPADLSESLRADSTLVSLMYANNEIGIVHPIAELAEITHQVGALFHTDAVQAVGWLDCNIKTLGIDALSFSGHKVGAPKGSGAVFIKARFAVEPLLHGGGQEFERRSGTENVAWAVALSTALDLLENSTAEFKRVEKLSKKFIDDVLTKVPMAKLSGPTHNRLANIIGFTFAGLNGETILLELERRGIICSSGSACAAGSDEPSHVLIALGYDPDLAQTAVRFSLGHFTTEADLDQAVAALVDSVT